MPGVKDLPSIWNNIKEMDLRPLRNEALRGVKIALVGRPGVGKRLLADQMRRDPLRPNAETLTPLLIIDLDDPAKAQERASQADLVILLLPAVGAANDLEQIFARYMANAGRKILVFLHQPATIKLVTDPQAIEKVKTKPNGTPTSYALDVWAGSSKQRVVAGSVEDAEFLLKNFVPAVLELLPERLLALGRDFPLFRVTIGRGLINEACFSNAAYSFSTGLAEIVPGLGIPLSVADMVVLTKTQAFLVYKLGLVLGLSTRWQDYVSEFGGVLGSGFIWRQVARQLVGLIPAWGILPKVAVAYAGTNVVGNVVLQWYLTGRHVTRQQMRQLYAQAFGRGKELAAQLVKRLPRPRRSKKSKALPPPRRKELICPACGKTSARDAKFCQYCGQPF